MRVQDVISREEYNATREVSYDQFCVYMRKVVKLCVEESLKVLPMVITHLASQAAYLKELSDKFYEVNKDLAPHRKIIAQEIERIESENPGMSYEDILTQAAEGARGVIAKMSKTTDFNPKQLDRFDSHLGKL